MAGRDGAAGPRRFLIVAGAAKAGTSSLAGWLAERPDVAQGPRKEPRYFTVFDEMAWSGPNGDRVGPTVARERPDYLAAFARHKPGAEWGLDASTDYLWHEPALGRILAWRERFPVKVVVVLRDPIDRAISEYRHTVRDHIETESLTRSIELEPERRAAGWHPLFYHVRRSQYAADVARFRAALGDDLLVLGYGELADRLALLRKLEAFAGLAPMDVGSDERRNASHVYRSAPLARMVRRAPALRAARRMLPTRLRARFRGRLQRALRRDFEASESELALLRERLAEDIAACVADPDIPTGGWRRALGG
ncbi:MAG: hypothetical protein ACFBWO_18735 [Paracoccaceae bacterium]